MVPARNSARWVLIAAAISTACVLQTNAQPTWTRSNPPFPLTGRSYGVTTANASAFISVGGRRDDGSLSGLSLGYDVARRQFVETPTSLIFDRSATAFAPDGTTFVFGGVDASGNEHNALWQLSTTGGAPSTTVLSAASTLGGRPTGRRLSGMAYLQNCTGPRACLVVFGGERAKVKLNDAWAFWPDTLTWTQPTGLNTNAPTARSSAAMVASADNTRAYVFGGDTVSGTNNDVYVLAPAGFSDAIPAEMTNMALNKFAYQSSNDPTWGTRGGRAGTDGFIFTNFNGVQNGNPATCNCNWCSHSLAQTDAWWALDLGAVTTIDFFYIYTRSDCCTERNQNLRFFYGNSNTSQYNSPGVVQLTGPSIPSDLRPGGPNIIPTSGISARYIYVLLPGNGRVMSMCEFQAFQRKPWIWRMLSGTYNAALLKTAAQSSTLSGWGDGLAFRAVDGIQTNSMNDQPYTCSHTNNDVAPGGSQWWLVDLGATHDVSSITVWPRTDCCTGRNRGIQWYVGNSRDWKYDSFCKNSPADITPPGGQNTRTFSCPSRGRYVLAVLPIPAGGDYNIMLCEVIVTANRLLDQPAARASMSYTTFGGSLVVFGGADSSGFRYNDVRMFDMERNRWLAPVTPLGTPPVARAFASFFLLPNATSAVTVPSNQLALFGGFSNTDQLNDFLILSYPQCPPYDRTGIVTESCRQGGTACFFTCSAFTTNTNGANPLICQPDGTWRGITPPCRPFAPSPPQGVTAVLSGNSVNVAWSAPSTSYYPVTGYKASALINDVVEIFPENKFIDATKWTLLPTYTGPCPSPLSVTTCTFTSTVTANTFDFKDGMLRLNSDLNRNTWFDQRESIQMIREFPTAVVDPAGSWAMETYMKHDREEIIAQGGQMSCLGLVDMGKYNNTGVMEFYAGIMLTGGTDFRVGWESSINTFNNWYSSNGRSEAFIRIERDATYNPVVYRSYYKYRNADNWIKMPVTVSETALRDGRITSAANLRPVLANRNWNGGVRFVAMYSYLRIGPLTCGDPGTIRLVDRLITSSTIYGLAPKSTYFFGVSASSISGWSSVGTTATAITMPAVAPPAIGALVLVSQNKPCTASTTYGNNPAYTCNQAFDGSIWTNIFHSESWNPDGEWITVDLQFSTAVKTISIYNRNDCCIERIREFSVYVGDNTGTNFISNARCDPALVPTSIENGATVATPLGNTNYYTNFQCQLTGRYVTVQIRPNLGYFPFDGWLHMREIQVFAGNTCPNRGATGATQVVGTRCSSAGWGALCTYNCLPGYIQVGGATSSACNGEAWDAPELVCAPACTDLVGPQYGNTCRQTYYFEEFNTTDGSSLTRLMSLETMTQRIGLPVITPPVNSKWFNMDGVLQAAARYGCNSDLHLVIASQKIRNYPSSFVLSAKVSTSDRAGLIWRAQDKLNMYRFYLDVNNGINVVEKVVGGNIQRISDFTNKYAADTIHSVQISMFNAEINVTVNGILMLQTADRQFLVGYAGVYSQTIATFDDLGFEAACSGTAIGATNNDIATFTCAAGLISVGPTARRCVQVGVNPSWVPDPAVSPLTCTLPPPTFIPSTLMVRENSEKNTVVGDPLVAYSTSPDYQIQYQITAGNDEGIFWVDACSGQVKLRLGGPGVLDFELRKTYILSVRAFIPGFVGAEAFQNITISVLNLDEPPLMIAETVYLTENAARLSSGTFVWRNNLHATVGTITAWDPENSTLQYALTVDGAEGALLLNTSTGVITVAPGGPTGNASLIASALSFEGQATALILSVTASQRNDSTMFGTDQFTVVLVDANDPPYITRNQVLFVSDIANLNDVIGTLEALDEDAGAFANPLAYTQVYGAAAVASCGVTSGFYPSQDETQQTTTANALFDIDIATGVITLLRSTTTSRPATQWKNWDEDLVFVSNGRLARATYTMCVNVTDNMGGFDVQPVTVVVQANVPAKPQILNVTGATQMSTVGNEYVYFNGAAFFPPGYSFANQPPLNVWYSNGVTTYNATCSVAAADTIACLTKPGIGANHMWTFVLKYKAVLATTSLVTSYKPPSVATITGNTNMETNGSTLVSLVGADFGPPGTQVTVFYGRNFEYPCSQQANNFSHTLVTCTSKAGSGKDLPFTITVGGQISTYAASNLWAYSPPTILSVTPQTTSFRIDQLDSAGGQTVVISGMNFGPAGTLNDPMYGISVTYGGTAGALLTFVGCQQAGGSQAHTTITCNTVPGVSTNHKVFMTVDGQNIGPAWPATNATGSEKPLSYLPPVISRMYGPGSKNADTAGGQLVYIEGKHFGPITFPLPTIDSVVYGRVGDIGRYKGQNCRVTSEPPQLSVITCATDEGIGRDHFWSLSIGGQSAPVYAANTSYAAPQVISFSDAGAVDADTLGGESVIIYGRNLGPADAFTNSRIVVYYGVDLLDGGAFNNVTYLASSCAVITSHTNVRCTTLVGAGKDLNWEIILDGQESTNPTTNYHMPEIDSIVLAGSGLPVTAADVDGGDVVLLKGRYFGPSNFQSSGRSLVQRVTYGLSGSEYIVPAANWVAIDDNTVQVTMLPGVGVNLRFRISVADQTSLPSTGTFSYAIPVIEAVLPNTAQTYSNPRSPTIITIKTRNFPLKDVGSRYQLTFGQGIYQMILPLTVPVGSQAIAAAKNDDLSINATFALPKDHLGEGLAIKISVLQGDSAMPVISTNVTVDSSFTYNPLQIFDVVVTRALFYPKGDAAPNGDYVMCPFPDNSPVWSCTDPTVMQIFIAGENFGAQPDKMDHIDGVARSLQLLCRNYTSEGYPELGEIWAANTCKDKNGVSLHLWLHSWDHKQIVAFSNVPVGTLKVQHTFPPTWNNELISNTIVRVYKNDAPAIGAIRGDFTNIPCAGSITPFELDIENLGGSSDLTIDIGGRPATLIFNDCRAGSPTNGQDVIGDTIAARAALIACGTPPVWTIKVLAPIGQGSSVPILVTRYTAGTTFVSNTNTRVQYAIPVVTSVAWQLPGDVTFTSAAVSLQNLPTVMVPTDATARVRFIGTNLGIEPMIDVGDGMKVDSKSIEPCWTLGNNFTCWEYTPPAGEGDGTLDSMYDLSFKQAFPFGYKMWLTADDQESNKIPFRYQDPVVTAIVSTGGSSASDFPTQGGLTVTLTGENFGVYNPVRGRSTEIIVNFTQPSVPGSSMLQCLNVQRTSHYSLTCTLPEGSGRGLGVMLSVAGLVGGTAGGQTIFSYNYPKIDRVYSLSPGEFDGNFSSSLQTWTMPVNAVPIVPGSALSLRGSTEGGDWIFVEGRDFGAYNPSVHCIFMTWSSRSFDPTLVHTCNAAEDFLGEGEVPSSQLAAGGWSHTLIAFRTNAGLGHKELEISVRGSTLSLGRGDPNLIQFEYNEPVITSLTPERGDTEGNEWIELTGYNFGPKILDTTVSGNALPDGLWTVNKPSLSVATTLPMAYVMVVFHSNCMGFSNTITGAPERARFVQTTLATPTALDACSQQVTFEQSQNKIRFKSPGGVGANKNVTIHIVDFNATQISNRAIFSYKAPSIRYYEPSFVYMTGNGAQKSFDVYGDYFGDYSKRDDQHWSIDERKTSASVGGLDCEGGEPARNRIGDDNYVTCKISPDRFYAGLHNFSITIAGQTGFNSIAQFNKAVKIVCARGAYARTNETCLPCPQSNPENPTRDGAVCEGFVDDIYRSIGFDAAMTYPVPLPGWYNLNSSDMYSRKWSPGESMMNACPEGFQDHGRDVCIVPCDPADSCLKDNYCAYGYTSKPPMWRCSSCDTGFYKRAGECIKCPDSPAALFIGFIMLVLFAGCVGFFLNKRQVNIAVISIGVDFFQVLAIFSQSRIKWPPIVKELLHILSAFNLNIEIVAPECLIPDVSYKQKFWFIMLLPLSVGGLLIGGIFSMVFLWKVLKGMPKKKWFTHTPTLISSTLILFYMLYLYLTRTILDVFNCTPTMPPDGYTYLQVVFERCGVPGGTQVTLLPYAVAGLAVYTAGYPSFVGYTLWKNRELVMEDQLLRAKGVGNDRLSNPHAYQFRKMFGRSYFQFKPDQCLWILAIILRKFFIALTAVVFNKNASFQMAACLLVMFVAYAAQMSVVPYLSPSEYEDVLKAHVESSYTSAIHARLRAVISNIETRGRKKARKNLVNFEGKIDRSAILGILTGWLFNYNTVEQIMLFAAVIVCLMGIMYQANEVSSYYPESKDSVTAVVLATIILAIIYFFTVLVTEIVVLYNEAERKKQLTRLSRSSSQKGGVKGVSRKGSIGGDEERTLTRGRLVDERGEINTGKLDNQMNPLFMNKDGQVSSADAVGIETIMHQRTPPDQDLWVLFQQGYVEMHKQLQATSSELSESKRASQQAAMRQDNDSGSSNENNTSGSDDVVSTSSVPRKKAFAPKSMGSSSGGISGGGNDLSSFKSTGNQFAALRGSRSKASVATSSSTSTSTE